MMMSERSPGFGYDEEVRLGVNETARRIFPEKKTPQELQIIFGPEGEYTVEELQVWNAFVRKMGPRMVEAFLQMPDHRVLTKHETMSILHNEQTAIPFSPVHDLMHGLISYQTSGEEMSVPTFLQEDGKKRLEKEALQEEIVTLLLGGAGVGKYPLFLAFLHPEGKEEVRKELTDSLAFIQGDQVLNKTVRTMLAAVDGAVEGDFESVVRAHELFTMSLFRAGNRQEALKRGTSVGRIEEIQRIDEEAADAVLAHRDPFFEGLCRKIFENKDDPKATFRVFRELAGRFLQGESLE